MKKIHKILKDYYKSFYSLKRLKVQWLWLFNDTFISKFLTNFQFLNFEEFLLNERRQLFEVRHNKILIEKKFATVLIVMQFLIDHYLINFL